jgi:predicted phosphodiesterase
MKIRLLSDLHIEFYDSKLPKNIGEDVLVLAGDIHAGSVNVIKYITNQFMDTRPIIYVPGNHEYYGSTIEQFDKEVQEAFCGTNVHFLNPGQVTINNVQFIGATLWSDFNNDPLTEMLCKRSINDFRQIKAFDIAKAKTLNREHKQFIFNRLDPKPLNIQHRVIVTHFLPAWCCIDKQYLHEGAINHYFANQLDDQIADLENSTWLHGHTHSKVDKVLGMTKVTANPYGYLQNSLYKEQIINIGD